MSSKVSDYILTHRWAYNTFGVAMMLFSPFILIAEALFDGLVEASETAIEEWGYMTEQYKNYYWPSSKNWKRNKL